MKNTKNKLDNYRAKIMSKNAQITVPFGALNIYLAFKQDTQKTNGDNCCK
jgi:hypothetical protein